METGRTPTELGYLLMQLMAEIGVRPWRMAKEAGLGASTLTRIMYGETESPDPATLDRIARTVVTLRRRNAGRPHTPAAVADEAADLHGTLMAAAGYRLGVAPEPRKLHPLAVELDQFIGEGSRLNADEIRYLVDMVGRLVEPYRRKARKRTS